MLAAGHGAAAKSAQSSTVGFQNRTLQRPLAGQPGKIRRESKGEEKPGRLGGSIGAARQGAALRFRAARFIAGGDIGFHGLLSFRARSRLASAGQCWPVSACAGLEPLDRERALDRRRWIASARLNADRVRAGPEQSHLIAAGFGKAN